MKTGISLSLFLFDILQWTSQNQRDGWAYQALLQANKKSPAGVKTSWEFLYIKIFFQRSVNLLPIFSTKMTKRIQVYDLFVIRVLTANCPTHQKNLPATDLAAHCPAFVGRSPDF